MRRVLLAGVAGLVLGFAAACGNDDGGGGDSAESAGPSTPSPSAEAPATTEPAGGTASNEEVCTAGEELLGSLDGEAREARDALNDAVAAGDVAEIEAARDDYLELTGQVEQDLRDLGATAADPELAEAVETFADEFGDLVDQVAEDPAALGSVDQSGLQAAADDVGEICGF